MFHKPEDLLVFAPLLICVLLILRILVRHQQRMAEIIHGSRNVNSSAEVEQLRQEVAALQQLVHQQAFILDGVANRAIPAPEAPLHSRLDQN